MLKKAKRQGVNWDYLRDRHSDVLDELKTLRDWDSVKSAIPESEHLGDYSILALEAIGAVIREIRMDRSILAERIEILNKKFEELNKAQKNDVASLDKRIKELESHISDIEQRTLFLDSVEMLVPRINELEERLQRMPAEITKRMEERYGRKIDEYLESNIEDRLKEFEEQLKKDVFGVSVDLAKTLREIQEHYEALVEENVRLRSAAKERDELRKALLAKEKEVEDLKAKLAALGEMSKRVDALSKRLSEYEARASKLAVVIKELASLTGKKDIDEALKVLKTQFVPRAELEKTVKEVRSVLSEVEEIRRENERLKVENEKLKDALRTLLQEKLAMENKSDEDSSDGSFEKGESL